MLSYLRLVDEKFMNKRYYFIIDAVATSVFVLTGMYFLLTPESQLNLFGSSGGAAVSVAGMIFFLAGLACAIPISVPVTKSTKQITEFVTSTVAVVLFWLYMRSGYFVESGIIALLVVAKAFVLYLDGRRHTIDVDILKIMLGVLNVICGSFLLIEKGFTYNLPDLTGWSFVITGVASLFLILSKFKQNRLLNYFLVFPWVVWCGLFFISFNLTHIISPISLVVMILIGDTFPWERLSLPKNDIVGRRVVFATSTTLAVVIGVVSGLLFILEGKLTTAEIHIIYPIRLAIFWLFLILSLLIIYGVSTILITINGLTQDFPLSANETNENKHTWNQRISRFLSPFSLSRIGLQARLDSQASRIDLLTDQLNLQKRKNTQLILLGELSQQLETQLEQPVAAQLVVNALEHAVECDVVCVYTHEIEKRELIVLASAGTNARVIPWGYRQNISVGVLGRAVRQRKTQVVDDTKLDPDFIALENERSLSILALPVIYNGYVHGVLKLTAPKVNAFSSADVSLVENAAEELARSWSRSIYYQKLTELIESGASLSSMISPLDTTRQIATISRNTLQARFVYAKIQPGQENTFVFTASSGFAPKLLQSIEKDAESNSVFKMALQASHPFRIRDINKNISTLHLDADQRNLRSLLVIPIRLHRLNVGVVFAFGKQDEVFFTEDDESLARLIATQAAGAFESTWLQDELRTSLTTTSLLYQLSIKILQALGLREAAFYIAQTAQKLSVESEAGIVLFLPNGQIETEVGVDASGKRQISSHPMALIEETMSQKKTMYISRNQISAQVSIPIQTPLRIYGVLWINIPDERSPKAGKTPDLQTLANQAALALERLIYLEESRRQADELEIAYSELELTYDRTLAALMSSLDARDRETEGHSTRVSQMTVKLGSALGLSAHELKILERGSLLHDIGKIGVSDTILHKPGQLTEAEWKLMKLHPDIGARIVAGIPFLLETIPLIRHHQERWDGSGYPDGLRGDSIPLLARIFSVIDAFDALTTLRPYREKITAAEAFQYIRENKEILFDPKIVDAFEEMFST